jgi:competence protein ComGC
MDNQSRRHAGFKATEIVIIAAVIAVVAAIAVPIFIKARNTPAGNACVNNLRQIDSAKQQWALEKNITNGTISPLASDIQPYLGRGTGGTLPYCWADPKKSFSSSYIINNLKTAPQCRFSGLHTNHTLASQ